MGADEAMIESLPKLQRPLSENPTLGEMEQWLETEGFGFDAKYTPPTVDNSAAIAERNRLIFGTYMDGMMRVGVPGAGKIILRKYPQVKPKVVAPKSKMPKFPGNSQDRRKARRAWEREHGK